MELQVIQTRTLFASVLGGRCEDCENEEVRQTLEDERIREESLVPGDQVTLSKEARRTAEIAGSNGNHGSDPGNDEQSAKSSGANSQPRTDVQLTEEEKRLVEELRRRDREVRAHEQAHKAVAGSHARGAPTYTYQTGPDGRRYAVGGEVAIDTSPVPGDPQATITKAQTIRRAALAPSEPSGQDRSVAAQATRMENQARAELREEQAEKQKEAAESKNNNQVSQQISSGNNSQNPFTRKAISGFEPTVSTGDLLDIIS